MIMRVITLPAINRQITLKQYVKAIKTAKAHPDEEFKCGLTTWWPTKGKEIMKQFMRGVHDRINQGIPAMERGQ
jgi:hypothetical protein